ncbi:Protein of unknown function (DUF2933) [Dongia mobilis]|uniref:DUF2933 family protein n=1 Tax=Dongia mobilis TaxID=578943 RepID=A0A4R6WK51_9PROT|nr:DUF2933 domain-containing protein [Dongia mobilis]TDQ78447.1 Protein of unknown function (DUF2933) [Dongia mobilis]
MVHHHDNSPDPKRDEGVRRTFLRTPAGLALCLFLAIGGVLLWLDHQAHILGVLPLFLPLLICLGMHFFMHRGHGGGHHEQ